MTDYLILQATQEIGDSKYLDVIVVTDGEQVAVSAHDIDTLPFNRAGYELIVIRITTYTYIRTDPDDFKFGYKLLKWNPLADGLPPKKTAEAMTFVSTTILICASRTSSL